MEIELNDSMESSEMDQDQNRFEIKKFNDTDGDLKDAETIAKEWLDLLKKNELTSKPFKEFWRFQVPNLFSPEKDCNCLKITHDENAIRKRLFEPLERFLSDNRDPKEYFKSLTETPATLCGRVFKAGEPTYSCRDCAMDPTCVLCVECFKKSAHKSHKYKISTSTGGGYCDCGDTEAWKSSVFCEDHIPVNQNEQEMEGLVPNIPNDLAIRTMILFETILDYCHSLFSADLHTQLPSDLQLLDSEIQLLELKCNNDTYCTVLYNDETHTFDLVIQILTRAVECTKKEAVEFATTIDREGRSIVKCSYFQACHQIKQIIERQTSRNGGKALKVAVLLSHVVAHESFAMRLLTWLQDILNYTNGFRHIFCDVICKKREKNNDSLLESILRSDTGLWKSVRVLWHNLFIVGMLKEYDKKREFAKVFSKHYADLMKDFIGDDHDHSFSVTSLSVQIFTVPTLAHFLIETYGIFATILRTFLSECEQKLNEDKKLEFGRGLPNASIKRTNFAVLDLKYILTSPPNEWTEGLRLNFVAGLKTLLKLLNWMQEMDSVTRQTGQHMEYEPEWETAFNLHIKLSPVITLAVEWCNSDRKVLLKAYRETLKEISSVYLEEPGKAIKTEVKELANHSATCYLYDVSTQPVSVHLPLTRIFASLHLLLQKYDLNFSSSEFAIKGKPNPELIIEPALRTQVLISQVHAGMWKRNGYSLLNQLYFYHNVRCRNDMFEKDIVTLQIGASLIESNEFMIHVLNRFNLLDWAQPNYDDRGRQPKPNGEEDSIRHTVVIVEEFFGLLNSIISARFVPGVGTVTREDCIKKEVIQLLCIQPMTHSNLDKCLVENVNYETGLDTVIDEVANFTKPCIKGGVSKYELKPELFEEYDVFFCHYSREEQSRAEEKQRERLKKSGLPEVFPPPKLPPFTPAFSYVINILMSDIFLYLVNIVLERCIKSSRSFTDSQLRKVLFLIGHALNEEFAQKSTDEEPFFQFTSKATKLWHIFFLLDQILANREMSQHHEMIIWIKKQHNLIKGPQDAKNSEDADSMNLQSEEDSEKKKRAKLAAEARAKIMAKISEAQKRFMKVNADLFVPEEANMQESTEDNLMNCDNNNCLEYNQSIRPVADEVHICILCQEEQAISVVTKPFVMGAFVQRSTVLCNYRTYLTSNAKKFAREKRAEPFYEQNEVFLSQNLLSAPMITCCGHIMHLSCWQKHFEGVVNKERRRPYRHILSFDIDKHEYLCPMCDCISNTVIPLSGSLNKLYPITNEGGTDIQEQDAFNIFVNSMQNHFYKKFSSVSESGSSSGDGGDQSVQSTEEKNSSEDEEFLLLTLERKINSDPDQEMRSETLTNIFPTFDESPNFASNFKEMIQTFTQAVFSIGYDTYTDPNDPRAILLLWQGLTYTIKSWEAFHRDQQVPFFGDEVPSRRALSLRYLVRACSVAMDVYESTEAIQFNKSLKKNILKILDVLFSSKKESILECDAVSILLSLIYMMSCLFPKIDYRHSPPVGTLKDKIILQLVLCLHITQVILTGDFNDYINEPISTESKSSNFKEEKYKLERRILLIWELAGKEVENKQIRDVEGVWKIIEIATSPFMRCAAKFFENLTGVPVPKSFEQINIPYNELLSYMGLNKLKDMFSLGKIDFLLKIWLEHPKITKIIIETSLVNFDNDDVSIIPRNIAVKYPQHLGNLHQLPEDYTELINSVSLFTCHNRRQNSDTHDARTPTICLLCGTMLCSQSYCCQGELLGDNVGACSFHSYYCGAGIGIFLRIRECKLFFLSNRKGSFMLPPYVDEYGETDQGLRRGNPMTLCKEKYDNFRKSWLMHEIPEEIARYTEHSTNIIATEWHYL